MDERARKLAFWETIGSIVWFPMDGCWMRQWDTLAIALIVPTLATNLMAFRYTERRFTAIAITVAIHSWLCMNVFWMLADIRGIRWMATAGDICFGLGMTLIAAACVRSLVETNSLDEVVLRFRRLRLDALLRR